AAFTLTNLHGAASAIAVVSGGGQSAPVGAAFGAPLIVVVTDSFGNVISGVPVTFGAPGSGATAVLGATMATTASNGAAQITITATANAAAGSYSVTASTAGVAASVMFALTNQLLLALSPSAPTVAPRASITFTATGGSAAGYVFSLTSAPSGGTIDANTGMYRAGAIPNTVDVVSVRDSQAHTATTSVAVGPGLSLAADKALVPPRG